MKERTAPRGGPRHPIALKGTLHLGSGAEARVFPLVTRDLGAGGAQCSLSEAIPVGTRGLLRLAIPAVNGPSTTIDIHCRVVRIDGNGPSEVALVFDETGGPVLEALKRFLFRARNQAGR